MTFIDFKEGFNNILASKPEGIREGQYLMNYLGDIWYEEYKRLSSVHYYDETNIDCFYNDSLIPNTFAHLRKVWFNYPD